MSKYRNAVWALAAVIFLAAPLFAQEVRGTVDWRILDFDNPSFPKSYHFNGCIITPQADGEGVNVQAIDSNWYGKFIVQTITIKKNILGFAIKEERHTTPRTAQDGYTRFEETIGYDVFWAKCREAAQQLPKDVRAAFLGFYKL